MFQGVKLLTAVSMEGHPTYNMVIFVKRGLYEILQPVFQKQKGGRAK